MNYISLSVLSKMVKTIDNVPSKRHSIEIPIAELRGNELLISSSFRS